MVDTFVVRLLLVPCLAIDLGHRFWSPTRLNRMDAEAWRATSSRAAVR